MNKKKYSYFVGVMTDGGVKFVTAVNYANKYAKWETGHDALEFSMAVADDLVLGLLMNCIYAFTVKVPTGISFHNS